MNKELKAIYISMLSEDRSVIQGPIEECITEYSIATLSTWPGGPFARVILRHIIHNLKMDDI